MAAVASMRALRLREFLGCDNVFLRFTAGTSQGSNANTLLQLQFIVLVFSGHRR